MINLNQELKKAAKGKVLWKVNDCGCGYIITWTPAWLKEACQKHDLAYVAHDAGTDNRSRADIDLEFLGNALDAAGSNKLRRLQAVSYYYLARGLGWIVW